MVNNIFLFKELKPEYLEAVKNVTFFKSPKLPDPSHDYLGKTYSLPLLSEDGSKIGEKKYICVFSDTGYTWIEVNPTYKQNTDVPIKVIEKDNKIYVPENYIGLVYKELVIEDKEVIVEGELYITEEI